MRILNPFNSLKKLNISSIALALLLIAMPRIAAADVCFLPAGGCMGDLLVEEPSDCIGTFATPKENFVCEKCGNGFYKCTDCKEGFEKVNGECFIKACPEGQKRAEDGKCYEDCSKFTSNPALVGKDGYKCTKCPTDSTKYNCVSVDCGAHGVYKPAQNKCVCNTGYTGDKCQNCASGYASYKGVCEKIDEICRDQGYILTAKLNGNAYLCTQCSVGGQSVGLWKCPCNRAKGYNGTDNVSCTCTGYEEENEGRCFLSCAAGGYIYSKINSYTSNANVSNKTVCSGTTCPLPSSVNYYKNECTCNTTAASVTKSVFDNAYNTINTSTLKDCYELGYCGYKKNSTEIVKYYATLKNPLVDGKCQSCQSGGYTISESQKSNWSGCEQCPRTDGGKYYKCSTCSGNVCTTGANNGKCMAACSGSTPYWDADTCTCVSEPECVRKGYTFFEDNATQHNTTCSNACPSDNKYYAECHCSDGSVNSPWGGHTGTSNLSATMSACYTTTSCTLKGEIKYKNTVKRALVDGKCQTCAEAGYTLTAAQKANRSGCSQCAIDTSKWKCSGGCNSNYQLCSSTNTCVACNENMWNASSCTCNTCEGLGYTLTATQAANRSGCSTCPSDSSKYKCTGDCASGYTLCSAQNKCVPECDNKHHLNNNCECDCNSEFSQPRGDDWDCYLSSQVCEDDASLQTCGTSDCTVNALPGDAQYINITDYTASRKSNNALVSTEAGKDRYMNGNYLGSGWTCSLDGVDECRTNSPQFYNCTCPAANKCSGTNEGKCFNASSCTNGKVFDPASCGCVDECIFTFADGTTGNKSLSTSAEGEGEMSLFYVVSKKYSTTTKSYQRQIFSATADEDWITNHSIGIESAADYKYFYYAESLENPNSSARDGVITLTQGGGCNKQLQIKVNQEAGDGCTFTIDGKTSQTYNAGADDVESNGYTIVSKKDTGETIPYTATADVDWIYADEGITTNEYTAYFAPNKTSSARSGKVTLQQNGTGGCSKSVTLTITQPAGSCPTGYSNTVTSDTCDNEGHQGYKSNGTLDSIACGKCEGCASNYNKCDVASHENYNKCMFTGSNQIWDENTCSNRDKRCIHLYYDGLDDITFQNLTINGSKVCDGDQSHACLVCEGDTVTVNYEENQYCPLDHFEFKMERSERSEDGFMPFTGSTMTLTSNILATYSDPDYWREKGQGQLGGDYYGDVSIFPILHECDYGSALEVSVVIFEDNDYLGKHCYDYYQKDCYDRYESHIWVNVSTDIRDLVDAGYRLDLQPVICSERGCKYVSFGSACSGSGGVMITGGIETCLKNTYDAPESALLRGVVMDSSRVYVTGKGIDMSLKLGDCVYLPQAQSRFCFKRD